jgi:glucose/arabinose dehydrogenase
VFRWIALALVASSSCSAPHDGTARPTLQARPSALVSSPPESPAPIRRSPTLDGVRRANVRLVKVVYVKDPVALATRPGDATIYVGQRKGIVWAIRDGELDPKPVLDISPEVSFGGDRGLAGMTFSPDGTWLYVDYTDLQIAVRVVAFPYRKGRVVRRGARDIITIPQPGLIHHAGDIHFGPDGDLWISTGDAQPESASETATVSQSVDTLLGKLLRIMPTPSGRRPYRIPSGNPFVGNPHARPEIFAYGLRNPWRFSFDRASGDLWIGDVGRYRMEEIDFLRSGQGAGANFGWNRLEGTLPLTGPAPVHSLAPLHEYPHTDGRCAVMGGYVYRGTSVPELNSAYIYADWCEGDLRAIVERNGRFVLERSLGFHLPGIVSFGEGANGELYALSVVEGVFRLEGG